MKLYGIPNCNTVKKARDWLATHDITYTFHDFKKQGISAELLAAWLNQLPETKLINRAGLTWRGLDEATKLSINNHDAAIALMLTKTSVIKRPVLEHDGKIIALGFSEAEYQVLFTPKP
ncbi:MAG TPA: ArsC family reductase [Methylophilus sp.]